MGERTQDETTLHVKVPGEWYEAMGVLSERCEGTIHQQARLAIRERLKRCGLVHVRGDAAK